MADESAYTQTTQGIRITVYPIFLDHQSTPEDNHFLWAYHVKIENLGAKTVQLKSRYWRITDALGRVQEVHGGGVVGEHPIIEPGKEFEYTSGTPLSTPSGIMSGHYSMQILHTDQEFNVSIPPFSLDSPHQAMSIN